MNEKIFKLKEEQKYVVAYEGYILDLDDDSDYDCYKSLGCRKAYFDSKEEAESFYFEHKDSTIEFEKGIGYCANAMSPQLENKKTYIPLDDIEKSLKALEIIITKRVDVYALFIAYNLEEYNDMVNHRYELTQEEFDFLIR